MFILESTLATATPELEKSWSEYPIDCASSSAFLKAPGDEISGCGAPCGTTTASMQLATVVIVLRSILPDASAAQYGGMMSVTSPPSPLATEARVVRPPAYTIFTLFPVL